MSDVYPFNLPNKAPSAILTGDALVDIAVVAEPYGFSRGGRSERTNGVPSVPDQSLKTAPYAAPGAPARRLSGPELLLQLNAVTIAVDESKSFVVVNCNHHDPGVRRIPASDLDDQIVSQLHGVEGSRHGYKSGPK
jgi:hypothetical protein